MRRYSEYKESGLEWIGEMPAHWAISKVRHEFESLDHLRVPLNAETRGSMKSKFYDYYGASGVIDKVEAYIFDEPLILIGEDGANLYLRSTPLAFKAIGKYWVNNHAHVLRPRHGNIDFLTNMLESLDYTHSITGAAQPKLTGGRLMNITVAIPSLSEQTQIANFLDDKTQKIDKLIRAKERKIELLGEYRASLINQAVTKGLDPDAEMKPSGIDWMGAIPRHWTTKRLKYLGESIIGLSYKPDNMTDDKQGTLVLRASNVQDGKPSFVDNVYVNVNIDEKLILKEGDILICSRSGSRDLIGKNMTITKELEGVTFGVFMTVFRTKFFRFISHFLNSQVFKGYSGLFLTSTINQLTIDTLNNFNICLPPDNEQAQIADFLDHKTKQIDELRSNEEQTINLLKEYRQSLISEAVTGKIDVRDEVQTARAISLGS